MAVALPMAQQRLRLRSLRTDRNLLRFIVEGRVTGKQLGTGSYGSVEEIEVNGLICAGKKIHDALIDADYVGIESIAGKYVQECQLMSDLRHPNITQFLGICFLPDYQLPVLLMERLDGSLDDLLETVPNIPLALKRSILEDVSRGLLYLHKHTPQIIHRDLTAKNVLLTSYFVAKIADLGNSRIVNLQPGQLASTLSRLPGTLLYMPPEALSASSYYGPSLDVFSFGHLALFTLIQVFPGNLLEPNHPDPSNPTQLLGRSEVNRREKYFEHLERKLQESAGYPLVGMVKQCLKNIPQERPTAEQLVRTLDELKGDIEGPCGELTTMDAARQVKTTMALKKRSREQVDEVIAMEGEIQQLQQQLQVTSEQYEAELCQKGEEIQQKEVKMNRLQTDFIRVQNGLQQRDAQLEQHVNMIQQLNTQLREKDDRLRQREEELQQKETQLQEKREELQQRDADIIRLQGEIQGLQDSDKNSTYRNETFESICFNEAEGKAHVSFLHCIQLECDSNGLEYTVEDHDITLRVPRGAVAKNQTIHFEIGVALYGPFVFPPNTQPISPIVWLCISEGAVVLQKPFRLIVPHVLIGLTRDKLQYHQIEFAKAVHRGHSGIDGKHQFVSCNSKPLFASSGSKSYAVLESTHCCYYCLLNRVTFESARDAGYCLVRIERPVMPKKNEVYFTAVYCLNTCIKALEEQFLPADNYHFSRYVDFKFGVTEAELEDSLIKIIPSTYENDQCTIALEPSTAEIRASDINFWKLPFEKVKLQHEKNMYPPRVKMTVTMKYPDHAFKLPVKISGCSGTDQLDVDITFPLGFLPRGPQLECRSNTIVGKDDKIDISQLRIVFRDLFSLADEWKAIGTLLGVSPSTLQNVQQEEQKTNNRLQKMVVEWLKMLDPPPTWMALAEAVELLDTGKAQKIRNRIAQ